jgi:hypothetical protein
METRNIDIGKKISAKRSLGATQIDSRRIKTKNFPPNALHFGHAGALGHDGLTCSGHAGQEEEPPARRYEASAPTPKATADTTSSEVYLSGGKLKANTHGLKNARKCTKR